MNFTQLVLDDEMIGMVNRAMEGMDVDEESLGFDAIAESIESDNLLMHPHTLKHMRSNRYRSKLLTRSARATWEAEGSKSMRDRAVEKANRVLENHQPFPLEADKQKSIEELIEEAESKLIQK